MLDACANDRRHVDEHTAAFTICLCESDMVRGDKHHQPGAGKRLLS